MITLVRDSGGEADHLSRWAGLGKRSPLVAGLFALFLLTFAGIPLTSGFIGKFAVFSAAIAGGATPLVIVGVVSSAIAAFFYVRVIVLMFFSDPVPDGPVVAVPSVFTGTAVGARRAVAPWSWASCPTPVLAPGQPRGDAAVRPLTGLPAPMAACRSPLVSVLESGGGHRRDVMLGECVGRLGEMTAYAGVFVRVKCADDMEFA